MLWHPLWNVFRHGVIQCSGVCAAVVEVDVTNPRTWHFRRAGSWEVRSIACLHCFPVGKHTICNIYIYYIILYYIILYYIILYYIILYYIILNIYIYMLYYIHEHKARVKRSGQQRGCFQSTTRHTIVVEKARHVSFKVLGMYVTTFIILALVKIKSNLT